MADLQLSNRNFVLTPVRREKKNADRLLLQETSYKEVQVKENPYSFYTRLKPLPKYPQELKKNFYQNNFESFAPPAVYQNYFV